VASAVIRMQDQRLAMPTDEDNAALRQRGLRVGDLSQIAGKSRATEHPTRAEGIARERVNAWLAPTITRRGQQNFGRYTPSNYAYDKIGTPRP
jgi:hypothetical protein